MITFYGYAIKKDGKWLGFNPKRDKFGKLLKVFRKNPRFPVVNREENAISEAYGYFGKAVKVRLTMEEVRDGE